MSNVQVKPLEWEDWSAQHRTNLTAMTQFGRYGVIQLHFPEMHYKIEPPVGKPLSALTLEAAKAAAQADYETRIRSALVPAPAVPDDVAGLIAERVREAVEAEREACAKVADEYASENFRMATDSVLLDRMQDFRETEERQAEGNGHSSAGITARNIAAAIRARGSKEGRDG